MAGAPPQGEDGAGAAASNSQTPADKLVAPAHPHPAAAGEGGHVKAGKWGLIIGAIGVVFGDIGTSPLYAMREALAHSKGGGGGELAVLGVVSLVTWALILIVTIKYVVFLMRADNKGEGGTLALMALAQRVSPGQRSAIILGLGMLGAALFYADGIITPAVTVMGAVEGLRDAPGVPKQAADWVLPIAAGILVALFLVQSRGTASMARFFGPITAAWFLVLAGLGLYHIVEDLSVLRALSPHYGVSFLIDNGFLGFIILGSIFLAVTGAEALYADMGHFGRNPIRTAWLVLALPCLVLNYLGQGALVLSHPETRTNPFFEMVPQVVYWPVLLLGTAAAVIASQAVISGAYSLSRQAIQLGLLPRLRILFTSETTTGQIYIPRINWLLFTTVVVLALLFGSSTNLASAYGIAVTATMVVDALLAIVVVQYCWHWSRLTAIAVLGPFVVIAGTFLAANSLKIASGGWVPIFYGGLLVLIMLTWRRGTAILAEKARRQEVSLLDRVRRFEAKPPHRVSGTAIFLTGDPDSAPSALLHNLKHNKIIHERNIILTIRTEQVPRVRQADRVKIEELSPSFQRVTMTFGYMETPNILKGIAACRREGLVFDIMSTSFFLSRRALKASPHSGMPVWQDKLFIALAGAADSATDYFHIPAERVVEIGAQVTI